MTVLTHGRHVRQRHLQDIREFMRGRNGTPVFIAALVVIYGAVLVGVLAVMPG